MREKDLGDEKGQKLLTAPLLPSKNSCPYCGLSGGTIDQVTFIQPGQAVSLAEQHKR
jgi:hypothetical protein